MRRWAAWPSSRPSSTGSTWGWRAIRRSLRVYPDPEDLGPARRRLTLFLAQYWGGPPRYGEERGHPRLRMRHAPFEIGPGERDRWLHHMTEAVRSLGPREDIERALLDYFATAAEGMRNHA